MKSFVLIKLLLLISTLTLTGCASLFSGKQQAVTVKTTEDAEIFMNGRYVGKGYTVKQLNRDAQHTIKVVKGDCESEIMTQPRFNKTSLLGLMLDLGLLTIPTDFLTGAAWNIYPNKISMVPNCDNKQS